MTQDRTGMLGFLRSRIDEDTWTVGQVVSAVQDGWGWEPTAGRGPERVVREAAAKQAILDDFTAVSDNLGAIAARFGVHNVSGYDTLRHLAAVYADHPDYQEEWKP